MTSSTLSGIWMNHSKANLMEFSEEVKDVKLIKSEFTPMVKRNSLAKSENLMHNKEQHLQSDYYKNLGEFILKYKEVVLFGPTDAKSELNNMLKADRRFENIIITVKHAGAMSENQQHAFVRDHFNREKV